MKLQACIALGVILWLGPQVPAQTPAAASRPNFSGAWQPADPAKSDKLFDVGLSYVPGSGRLTIEQTERRFTMTITRPDDRLEPLPNISGRFIPTIVYRIYESGRAGGGGRGDLKPSLTSWLGDRLVIPDPRPGSRLPMTSTFSMEGDRLKMETRAEVDAVRASTVIELFTKVK